jgi:hypothetical protein
METGEIASVWIGWDVLLSPLPIPRGGTRAAFPAEPTRLRVRAGSAGQCRAKAARTAGRIDGRGVRRAILACFGSVRDQMCYGSTGNRAQPQG